MTTDEAAIELGNGRRITIRRLQEADRAGLEAFGAALPRDDWLYLDVELQSPGTVARLATAAEATNWRQIVAVDGDTVVGYANVRRLPGWKSHVGDIHLVVRPDYRRLGVGRVLASQIVAAGRELGVAKLILEISQEQTAGQEIFTRLGFRLEGILTDHARDHTGRVHTLLLLGNRLAPAQSI
jgi:ribosomal protein S18 acetylase RimI-like enzyme